MRDVRRTAIALRMYGLSFAHRPWSTFGEADKIIARSEATTCPP
jgi:hypothetical protein